MREHIKGAVQEIANNRLKFEAKAEEYVSLPTPADQRGHVHKSQPQPSREEVFAKMDTPEIKARVADLLSRYPVAQGALLEVLWLVQGELGWVPTEGIRWAANVCSCAPAHALGVATFYTMYNHAPKGRFLLQFCRNISCAIKGAQPLIKYVEEKLGVKSGETTADGMFTVLQVECLGSCGNGPMMLVNDDFATDVVNGELKMKRGTTLTKESIDRIIDWCKDRAKKLPTEPKRDVLGGIVKGHGGHAGAPGATAKPQVSDYAPPSPVLAVRAEADETGATLTWKGAPEFTKLVVEKKNGSAWVAVGEPGVKDKSFLDAAGKAGDEYRMIATSGERVAKPSAVAVTTQKPAPEEKAV